MNRTSRFHIRIDFEQSHGSYLVDKVTGRRLLDFFGQYATLALGYNHEVFHSVDFVAEASRVARQKITNCEILSDESTEFDIAFQAFTSLEGRFTHYHYACTGALGVEAALKTAIDYRKTEAPRFITFKGSFHGINGYGGLVTDRFDGVAQRLAGFPASPWEALENPVIKYRDGRAHHDESAVQAVLAEIEAVIQRDQNVSGILVEPIQCTYGDRYFDPSFFVGLRKVADQYDIPLIFDEIQVGFGGTGRVWYFQHLPIVPDIVVFGKKTQLSGIMVQRKFAKIFEVPIRLEVTWDADVIDMVRCKYIMKAYEEYGILENVSLMSSRLREGLGAIPVLRNLRSCGLLFAFDFDKQSQRDRFVESLFGLGMICNPTGQVTVRLRPNLSVSAEEVDNALELITEAVSRL